MNFVDKTGQRFGLLTVVSRAANQGKIVAWNCVCDCGKSTVVRAASLQSGNTKSCGHLVGGVQTHGMTGTRAHNSWRAMRERCYVKTNSAYRFYGALGITVCDEWNDSFEKFYSDMGDPPEGYSIDRIDGTTGYSPDNCRWASLAVQNRNKKSSKFITYEGETLTVSEWARRIGCITNSIEYRLRKGWSLKDALTTPPANLGRRR